MCLLTFVPEGVQPNRDFLQNGTICNDDGHGWAIVCLCGEDAELHTFKSLDAQETIDAFIEKRSTCASGPALFHSRFATHGITNTDNCHPFVVNGDSRTVVGHNGILPKIYQPNDKYDERSDTRLYADDFLGSFHKFATQDQRDTIGQKITVYNKLVILTIDPTYDSYAYIINEPQGTWDKDCWYSNDGYQGWTNKYWTKPSPKYYQDITCLYCNTLGSVHTPSNYCNWCGTCQDCYYDVFDCECREYGTGEGFSKHRTQELKADKVRNCWCDFCYYTNDVKSDNVTVFGNTKEKDDTEDYADITVDNETLSEYLERKDREKEAKEANSDMVGKRYFVDPSGTVVEIADSI